MTGTGQALAPTEDTDHGDARFGEREAFARS